MAEPMGSPTGRIGAGTTPSGASRETTPQTVPQFAPRPVARPPHKKSVQELHIDELLELTIDMKGSDLHIASGIPPIIRADGELKPTPYENMTPLDIQQMMYGILTDEQIQKFESNWELDFSYALQKKARFRVNIFRDKGSVAASLRLIPTKIPTLEDMGMPPLLEKLTHTRRGLILVTGPTGSGKSTTLAAMINHINLTRSEHIITIEDPIEFVHNHKLSIINQRELGMDTKSFSNALRASLREDPDVILVGEMRDLETVALAVSAAETGHLVFGTLHTNSAASSVDRMVDIFPPGQQGQVRLQLSNNLQAIISQQLIPCTPGYQAQTGRGRVAAQEIMIANPAIRNLIREAKAHQITSIIQTSANIGMITTDACLRKLYNEGKISYENALSRAQNEEELKRMLAGQEADGSTSPRPGGGPPQRPQGR